VATFLAIGIELLRFGYSSISRVGALVDPSRETVSATNS